MNFVAATVFFLLGGASVIVLEIYEVQSFFDAIREFLQSFLG